MAGVDKRYRSFVKVDRPVGIELPRKMRCVQQVTELSENRFVFLRRQVNTPYTNPYIFASRTRDATHHLDWLMSILNGLRSEVVTELSHDYTHWYPDYPDMEKYDA